MDALLRTKLFIPGTRANLVPRPRLVERLNTGLDKKHVLIAAPAGFEKTTLLVDWLKQIDLATAHQHVEEEIGTILLSALQSPYLPAIKTENTNASHN
jgi:LuxR family maltose regulon positive regulatory protein